MYRGAAHLWFVTIHSFDDGNGRIARAIGYLALARADQSTQRYYSLFAQIQKERNNYYARLEKTQKGNHRFHHLVQSQPLAQHTNVILVAKPSNLTLSSATDETGF